MQRLCVNHKTVYRYKQPVEFGEHRLMIRPRESHDLRIDSLTLNISPPAKLHWVHDVFGNSVAVAEFGEQASELSFESEVVIERYPVPDAKFLIEPFAKTIPFSYPVSEVPDLGRTIERHHPDPGRQLADWTRSFLNTGIGGTDTTKFLLSMTAAIKADFTYEVRHDPGVQTPAETLERKAGSCRDFALLMMEAVRGVGLAARFVSGYLYDPAIETGGSGVKGAGYTHAWMEVYLPGAGWVEFDPTNGSYGGHNLVRVAVAREPAQAVPISGTYDGGQGDFVDLTVEVLVRRMDRTSNSNVA